MGMKLLIVNLQNPEQTKYRTSKGIGGWFLGRRLSNYGVFIVDNGVFTKIEFTSSDCPDIQAVVDMHIKENQYD